MAAMYWLKLYYEILDDYKMFSLSDHHFRRTIELFLLAGEFNKKGLLPDPEVIAWRLRADKEKMLEDMNYLKNVGILKEVKGEWVVTNFEKRQKPLTKKEYMKRKRDDTQPDYDQYKNSYGGASKKEGDKKVKFKSTATNDAERVMEKIMFDLELEGNGNDKLLDKLENCSVADDGKKNLLIIPDTKENGEWLQSRGEKKLKNMINGFTEFDSVEIVL